MERRAHRKRDTTALLLLVVALGLFGYGFRLVRVQGHSMAPTFADGQVLLVRRLNWPSPPVRVGEVVVFRMGEELLVKRVAASAGETIPYRGALLLLRPSRKHPGLWEGTVIPEPPRVVPAGHLYLLGDNRKASVDSRAFGLVPVSALVGRVLRWSDPGAPPAGKRHVAR